MRLELVVNLIPNDLGPCQQVGSGIEETYLDPNPIKIIFFKSISLILRGGSGFGEICYPSVENKFTDNPSANRPLIGSGGRVSVRSKFQKLLSVRYPDI